MRSTIEQKALFERNRLDALDRKRKRDLENIVQTDINFDPGHHSITKLEKYENKCASDFDTIKSNCSTKNLCCQELNNHVLCGNEPVDLDLLEIFNEKVCANCKKCYDDYQLVSHSDALSIYLLTELQLRKMKFTLKDNPKHSAWAPMKLFLKKHVRKQSYEKWGSKEGLEKEIMIRSQNKFKISLEKTKDALKFPLSTASATNQDIPNCGNANKNKRKKISHFKDIIATIRGEKIS